MVTLFGQRPTAVAISLLSVVAAACAGTPATPTVNPTGATTATPNGAPSPSDPGGNGGFIADRVIFSDDFSDDASGDWVTESLDGGGIGYVNDTLVIDFAAPTSLWTWHNLGQFWEVLRVTGSVSLGDAGGGAGLGCGENVGPNASPAIDAVGGLVSSDDEWSLFQIEDGALSEVDSGPLPEGIEPASPYEMQIECSGSATGALRVRLVIDDVEVATYEQATGIGSFYVAAVVARSDGDTFAASFDDFAVYGQ